MLKFSANISLLFTEVDLIDRFQVAKQHGFDAVEIQFPYELSAESIAKELRVHDLQLALFNVAADDLLKGGEGLACVPEKQAQFRAAVDQAVAYARLLKPNAINVLPGCCLDQSRYDDYLQTFTENLAFATQIISPLGIKTVFEAINTIDMPGFIINTGEQMLTILNQIKFTHLLMQYDIYHSKMMAEDPVAFISQHVDKIGHIQFADCPGRGQPGTGSIDFKEIFSAIGKAGYSGWVGAEYKPVGLTTNSLDWREFG